MGGKKAKGSNDAVVQEQRAQADEARRKETERQDRLAQGSKFIKNAFEGSPVMATRKVAKTRQVPVAQAAPPQNTWSPGADSQAANVAGDQQFDPRFAQANPGAGGGYYQQTGGELGGNGMQWVPFQNASVQPAAYTTENYEEDETYDTGQRTGGFDDAFYNKYGQAVSDYYLPQVSKQFADAGKELTFRLGRSGNLRSKAAADETADLSTQYDLNKANVLAKADTAKADLRNTVSGQRAKIESALLASEDPTQASNQALAAVRDISLQQPDLSPLGAIFNIATIGGANFLKGSRNAQYANAFGSSVNPKNASRNVG